MPREEYISVRQLLAEVNVLDVENFVVKVEREGKDLVLSPEALAALSKVDTNGRLHGLVDTSGQTATKEASAAAISSFMNNINHLTRNGNVLLWDAAGNAISNSGVATWEPIASVVGASTVITADGAGNIGAEAAVIAAPGVATEALDVLMICQVDTNGAYQTQWGQDATGTLAATTPDYFTANHTAYMVAGYPYILRMRTVTDNVNIGYGAGTNGEWPNSANMYITGYWRGV